MTEETKNPSNKRSHSSDLVAVLSSIVENMVTKSDTADVSLEELLKKVRSDASFKNAFSYGLALGLVLSDPANAEVIMNGLSSLSSTAIKDAFHKQRDIFIQKHRITEHEKLLVRAIVQKGYTLDEIEVNLKINHSTAAKKITRLFKRLGLANREQLCFVAGRVELISFQPECLRFPEDN